MKGIRIAGRYRPSWNNACPYNCHVGLRSYSSGPKVVESSVLPKLGKNLFSRKALEQIIEGDFRGNVPLNPLFAMSKNELLKLNSKKYKQLARLPVGSMDEASSFCINVVDIVNEVLMKDQRLVSSLINNLPNAELKEVILSSLRRTNYDNKIRLSMIEMLADVKSTQYRELFLYILETVLDKSPTKDEKLELVYSYLENLAALNVINPIPIVVPNPLFDKLVKLTTDVKLAHLFSLLLNLNIVAADFKKVEILQSKLIQGREIDRYVARTGELNARWHDTVKPLDNQHQREKIFHFMSFEMLESCARSSIAKKDIADANVYLDLLVSKFETICDELTNSVFVFDDVEDRISSYVHDISKIIMLYLMEFKGVESCLQILQYMKKNNLEIKFSLLQAMMQQLIKQKYYDDAIALANSIDLDKLDGTERSHLVTELFSLMAAKFDDSPTILLGYVASFFKNPQPQRSVVDLLNDLGILGLVEGSGSPKKLSQFKVLKADVDSRLTGQRFLHEHLYHIYKVALHNVGEEADAETVSRLFSQYLHNLQTSGARCFSISTADDRIVSLFLNHLLRQKGSVAEDKWIISTDRNNYETCKGIVNGFFSLKLNKQLLKPYPFALMTYCALIHHNDYSFATRLLQMTKAYNLPLTFNQIYPFIMYHYKRKEYENAKYWYDLLVHSGVGAKQSDMRNVYKIARELQWQVYGFLYRRNIIHKNYAKRKALQEAKTDRLAFLGNAMNMQQPESTNTGTFTENLTAMLQKPTK